VTEAQTIEQLKRLLIGLGAFVTGIGATVAGSWITGKIHTYDQERMAHRDEIRDKILQPLRAGLSEHVTPLLIGQAPILLTEHAATSFVINARVTEEPTKFGPVLVAKFPSARVFGPLDSALLRDAETNHLPRLFVNFNVVYKEWTKYSGDCHAWAMRVARQILEISGLPAFPNFGQTRDGYVMHFQLAVFLYQRLFRLLTMALQKQQQGAQWTLTGGAYTLAAGTSEQIDSLIAQLEQLRETENDVALRLREQASALHVRYDEFLRELDFAIASRKLHGHCDLVRFF
jgi:hypothetical protein